MDPFLINLRLREYKNVAEQDIKDSNRHTLVRLHKCRGPTELAVFSVQVHSLEK